MAACSSLDFHHEAAEALERVDLNTPATAKQALSEVFYLVKFCK